MEGRGKFFYSSEGAIWSRIVCINGLGPVERLTTIQIAFMALASGEDTRIKNGNGPVDRSKYHDFSEDEMQTGMSVAEYARQKKFVQNDISGILNKKRAEQKELRARIESQFKVVAAEEARRG